MVSDEMRAEVERLKREKDAVVLAHYYVTPDAQELADYVGDSFFLSKKAATLDCKTLVFAGVRFMAESAKLLSPGKTVLMPEPSADCPMAHMVQKATVDAAHAKYGDDLAVACYVNSTTEMKAWSDVCVTSSNAVKIVRALPQKNVLFIPDMNLGHYVALQVPEKNVILNDGFCPTHEAIELAEVEAGLADGSIHVFQGPWKGEGTAYGADAPDTKEMPADDWFKESDIEGGQTSAPYFYWIIEGITSEN